MKEYSSPAVTDTHKFLNFDLISSSTATLDGGPLPAPLISSVLKALFEDNFASLQGLEPLLPCLEAAI